MHKDVLFCHTHDNETYAITKDGFLKAKAALEDTGDYMDPELGIDQKAAEDLEEIFFQAESKKEYKYLTPAQHITLVTDDIYGWAHGIQVHMPISGWFVGTCNVLLLSTMITMLQGETPGFVYYIITMGLATVVALLSDLGFWWELVANHIFVGTLLVQNNNYLLPAAQQVLQSVWAVNTGATPIVAIRYTQEVLSILGFVLAILTFGDGLLRVGNQLWWRNSPHKDRGVFGGHEGRRGKNKGSGELVFEP